MTLQRFLKNIGSIAAVALVLIAGMWLSSRRGQAQDQDDNGKDEESKIEQGFKISPVKLNLDDKDRELVGLGSYIVNAQGDCNGCHTNPEFADGRNPYFKGQKKKTDPKKYLGGGVDFGNFGPNTPNIVSRNLTPDKSGKPEGGHTFSEFRQIMRTGVDLDNLHPNCSDKVKTNFLPPPFNGALLQIMPWPTYQSMTDHDLRAIYEYLSAIPCVAGPAAPSPLHNDCGEEEGNGGDSDDH